jgi:hypothetical protein
MQSIKIVLYKLLTARRGHFEKKIMFKNNASTFLEPVDFRIVKNSY